MNICTTDIETNCLLEDAIDYTSFPYKLKDFVRFWVVVITDIRTMNSVVIKGSDITAERLKEEFDKYDVIVAHHGHKYDLVMLMLGNLLEYKIGYLGEKDIFNGVEKRLLDTHIISRVLYPDRFGGHSLKAWGERVGIKKIEYRENLINLGVMKSSDPKGHEFTFYHESMDEYCIMDTVVTAHAFKALSKEMSGDRDSWTLALQMEHKLADLAIRRESLGFSFDKERALELVEGLSTIMEDIKKEVDPILPDKKLSQSKIGEYTPPKNFFKKDGDFTVHALRFFNNHNIKNYCKVDKIFEYEGNTFSITTDMPPLKTTEPSVVEDLDVVKHFLIDLGWIPTEWGFRDITKNSKKEVLSQEKVETAVKRYVKETLEGKYKEHRLKELKATETTLEAVMMSNVLRSNRYIVPTTPKLRVGVTKDLCPNLVSLGEKVSFARQVADFYTYRHRRSSIAGGITDDFEYDEGAPPETGFLAKYREEDGRIATPSIENGTSTFRYKHITVANIPRLSSIFGKEMRGLFGAGKGFTQFGFDYASLEARIQGHYIYNYEGGKEMSVTLLAEKPFDLHTVTANKLGLERDDAKSVNYMVLYGGSWTKVVAMLGYSKERAIKFLEDWWDANPSLKQLKEVKEREWVRSGKRYITTLDGRKVHIRSKHSIINALFQSAGSIFAKYVTVKMFQKFEEQGFCIDVFKGSPDIHGMIEYHDENQLLVRKGILSYKTFKSKEEAKEFSKNWKGGQLGSVQHSDKGVTYITMPSIISETITSTIAEVEEMFSMNVPIGYAYETGNNWADCH